MLQSTLSILFYLTFVFYLFMGVYGLLLNHEAQKNRFFFLLSMSFAVWAYAFAISNASRDHEVVFIWRRVASLGWGIAFSLILHFILHLTGYTKVLKYKVTYVCLYAPAIISILVFGVIREMAMKQYDLVHTAAGWGNIPVNNFWDMFYNVYYILFSLTGIYLLGKWQKEGESNDIKKQGLLLLTTYFIAMLLGTFTEMLLNSFLKVKLPSLAPIFILLPVIIFFYSIKKYGLLRENKRATVSKSGKILSEEKHSAFIKSISLIYVLDGLFAFLLFFNKTEELISVMLFSTVYIVLGVILFVLPNSGISIKMQDRVLTFVFASTIPLTMFHFSNDSASNIVWPASLILLMVTIVFNNRFMFICVAVTMVVTEGILWLFISTYEIQLTFLDYAARFMVYLVTIFLAKYINKTYIGRLKENDKHLKFQTMITNISSDFVNITEYDYRAKTSKMLKNSAEYTNSDASYLVLTSNNKTEIYIQNEWRSASKSTEKGGLTQKDIEILKWCQEQTCHGEVVNILDVNQLQMVPNQVKVALLNRKITSMILVPIIMKKEPIGFMAYVHLNDKKIWHIEELELLKILSNLVVEAINRIEIQKEIHYLAYYDALTGLPNRTLFSNRLEQSISLAIRRSKLIGVVFIDLDGFKAINDSLGHEWGDQLLVNLSKRLSNIIRKYDTICRFGGDEFLIMIPQISTTQELESVIRKIRNVFLEPNVLQNQIFHITASIGVSVFPADGTEVNALIKNADLAMYHAKNNGKNQYAFCSENMKSDVLNKMILTNALYRALERNELTLYYQPQVRLVDHAIIGFEALIRWRHPELGMISPAVFIPIAEQIGLIHPIGEWILRTACKQNKKWQEAGYPPVQMAVNISPEQFRNGDLFEIIQKCLVETALEPDYLEVEITEGLAMKASVEISQVLRQLQSLGVSVAIDDFGTEYSSLSRLKDLPMDRLKMDMQFVRGIGIHEKDESVAKVIIHLAKSLGLKVIAEGVETQPQLDFLREASCDEIQGYYFYKPLTVDEIEEKIFKSL